MKRISKKALKKRRFWLLVLITTACLLGTSLVIAGTAAVAPLPNVNVGSGPVKPGPIASSKPADAKPAPAAAGGAAPAAAASPADKIKKQLFEIKDAFLKAFNESGFDKPFIMMEKPLTIEVPKMGPKNFNIGLKLQFPFVGDGVDAGIPIQSGWAPMDASGKGMKVPVMVLPAVLPGAPMIAMALKAAGMDVQSTPPNPPTTTQIILGVTGKTPVGEVFEAMLQVRGDTIFLIRLAQLAYDMKRGVSVFADCKDTKAKMETLAYELNIMLARLSYTREPGSTAFIKDPFGTIVRMIKLFKLEGVFSGPDSVSMDVDAEQWYEWKLRANKPASPLLENVSKFRTLLKKFSDRIPYFDSKIVPLINPTDPKAAKLDYFDRRLLIVACTMLVKDLTKAQSAMGPDGKPKPKDIKVPAADTLAVLKKCADAMKAAGNFVAGTPGTNDQPKQPDLNLEIQDLIKTTDLLAQGKKPAEPVDPASNVPPPSQTDYRKVPVLNMDTREDYLAFKWYQLTKLMRFPFKGDKGYVSMGDIPAAYSELAKIGLALGFRVLLDVPQALAAWKKSEAGAKFVVENITPLQQKLTGAMTAKIAAAKKLELDKKVGTADDREADQKLIDAAQKNIDEANAALKKQNMAMKKLCMSYPYRVAEGSTDKVSVNDLIKSTLFAMFVRTKHFPIFVDAINRFTKPMGMDVNDMVASFTGDAAAEDDANDAAMMEGMSDDMAMMGGDMSMMGGDMSMMGGDGSGADPFAAPAGDDSAAGGGDPFAAPSGDASESSDGSGSSDESGDSAASSDASSESSGDSSSPSSDAPAPAADAGGGDGAFFDGGAA